MLCTYTQSWAYFSASGKCLCSFFWISSCIFNILQGLLVHCLQGLFLFGIVLLSLLVESFFWALLVPGHVAGLFIAEVQAAQVDEVEVARRDIHWCSASGLCRKRIRLNRKTPAHFVGLSLHARPRVWKRLHCSGFTSVSSVDCKRNQHELEDSPVHPRTGVG